jgi:hypothetical protein
MIRKTDPTDESFLKDVEKHGVTILLDNGVYRHVRCQDPKASTCHFDIITYPGHLCYSGDMGSFVFSRLNDMFEFFRTDRRSDGKLGINRSYWGEKLQAVDRDGYKSSHKRFSEEKLAAQVEEIVAEWISEYEGDPALEGEASAAAKKAFEEELREAIEDDVDSYLHDGEHEARKAVAEFAFKKDGHTYEFNDTWEWDCEDYTYRFTWSCLAIAWAIAKYDALKNTAEYLFYIQDSRSFAGNSVSWWAVDGKGYTSDLTKAWKVTRDKALSIQSTRDHDIAWPCSAIDAKVQVHFDMQDLREMMPLSSINRDTVELQEAS